MIMILGLAMLAGAGAMAFVAKPREGHMSWLLQNSWVEQTYALGITLLVGFGVACLFGGLASMAGGT